MENNQFNQQPVMTNSQNNKSGKKSLIIIGALAAIIIIIFALTFILSFNKDSKKENNDTKTEVKEENSNSNELEEPEEDEEDIDEEPVIEEEKQLPQQEIPAIKVNSSKPMVFNATYSTGNAPVSWTYVGETMYLKDIVVPYININSNDAKTANAAFQKHFNELLKVYIESTKARQDMPVHHVVNSEYLYAATDNYVSVYYKSRYGSGTLHPYDYMTYTFDKTGKLMTYKETYTAVGFTDANITPKATAAIKKYYEDAKYSGMDNEAIAEHNKNCNEAITAYNTAVKNNKLLYYINQEGNLVIVVNARGFYEDGDPTLQPIVVK